MVLVLFGTSTLFNQDHINGPSTSSLINIRDLLRDFDTFTLLFPPECFVPRVLDLASRIHFQINGCLPLRDFSLWRFQMWISPRSAYPEHFIRSSRSDDICPLTDWQLPVASTIRGSTISNFTPSFSPGVHDLSPCTLWIWRSIFSSALRLFGLREF